MKNVLYTKYSNERAFQFAIKTTILQEGERKWVEKVPLNDAAKKHIENLETAYHKLTEIYADTPLSPCPITVQNAVASFEFIEGESFQGELSRLIEANDSEGVIKLCQRFVTLVKSGSGVKKFQKTPEFVRLFGDVMLPEGLTARDYNNMDMIFENLIKTCEGKVILLDYEWCFPFPIPQEYILYRAIRVSLERLSWSEFVNRTLCSILGIDHELIPLFLEMDRHFSQVVGTEKTLAILDAVGQFRNQKIDFSHALFFLQQVQCHSQLFFDTGMGFQESQTQNFSHYYGKDLELRIPVEKNTHAFRLDPADEPVLVLVKKCCFSSENGLRDIPLESNGLSAGNTFVFNTNDPQFYILKLEPGVLEIQITLNIIRLTREIAEEYVRQQCRQEEARRQLIHQQEEATQQLIHQQEEATQQLIHQQEETTQQLIHQQKEATQQLMCQHEETKQQLLHQQDELKQQLLQAQSAYNAISNAFFWKITKPARVIIGMIKGPHPVFQKIRKAGSIWRRQGFVAVLCATKDYCRRKKQSRILSLETGVETDTGIVMYDSEYQANRDFTDYQTDVKVLAFHLPQFHTFPENDAWWGAGFTEWTNVRKGMPCFEGHYQPRTPHKDIGYYCLEDVGVIQKQAELAKQHGIYGFCFYYYWFSGKRLMEKPVDLLLEHPEIDIPFCLCWANENWTRRWDGQEQDILIKQEYSNRDDEIFIADLKKYLDDSRYIRVSGKPVIVVYSPCFIPDCRRSFKTWREKARELGIGEIQIWICLTWGRTAETMQILDCVDAEVEFPPHNLGGDWLEIPKVEKTGENAIVYDYKRAVDYITGDWETQRPSSIPKHLSCMMAWDNAARRRDGWHAFYRFSLKDFYRWVSEAVRQTRARLPEEERFLFINAWNEWGEGTYLEPDEKYGYANINTVSKAIFDLPFDLNTEILNEDSLTAKKQAFPPEGRPRIAVQAHVFYVDVLEEIVEQLNKMPYPFDLFITTDTEEKKMVMQPVVEKTCRCREASILVLPNRGRDVAPFLIQMAPEIDKYDYVGHIHSKKTVTADYGNWWRDYLFCNLFGNTEYIKRIFGLFESEEDLGLIMPEMAPPIREHAKWTGEHEGIQTLLKRMGIDRDLPEQLAFPAGNMFWARTAAIRALLVLGLKQTDFPEEAGQRYATLAHQIERIWAYVAESSGYKYRYVLSGFRDDSKRP